MRKDKIAMSQSNIRDSLQTAQLIHERMRSDAIALDEVEAQIKAGINQGASTGDSILDIVLEYGLPFRTGKLEQHLRALDQRIQECHGQIVLMENIRGFRSGGPREHSATIDLLATDAPSITRIVEQNALCEIRVRTQDEQGIRISCAQLIETSPFNAMCIGVERTVQLFVGNTAIATYLSPEFDDRWGSERRDIRHKRIEALKKEIRDLFARHAIVLSDDDPLSIVLNS